MFVYDFYNWSKNIVYLNACISLSVPSVPKDMKVTHRTSNTLSLSWQMPNLINGILKHFIVFYENSTKQYKVKIDKDLSNHTFRHQIVNLKESTKYTLMVRFVCTIFSFHFNLLSLFHCYNIFFIKEHLCKKLEAEI